MKRILAFDFGASSGRAMLGRLEDGRIAMEEIHRFSNDPVTVGGRMYWDVLRLFFEIKAGITKAVAAGGFDAISIDTWGVDYGLIGQSGRLLSNPRHYRDQRTAGMPEKVFRRVPKEELYALTGIQFSTINTLYQLAADMEEDPELFALADKMLMTPDLFGYLLTGEVHEEATIASTSNLFDPRTRDWHWDLIHRLGLPRRLFAPILQPGSVYGYLSDELCEELGCPKAPVIAVGAHDTASAVAAAPAEGDFAYISCGTWSLFGTELPEPLINADSAAANFTNEGGFSGTVRFLKIISGLWLVQESRRQWRREGQEVSFAELEQEALEATPFVSYINVDDPAFATAGNTPARIREYCVRTGQPVPESRGEVMRCIYQSLAFTYRRTLEKLEQITGKRYARIHMIGGGIKDRLLCQMTADACGVEVLAGPVEATAMGNIGAALCAFGELKDLADLRRAVAASTDLQRYVPKDASAFANAYEGFLRSI